MPHRRRTKILATLGPATDGRGRVEALVAAGVDGVRINCSHGDAVEWRARVERVRAAAARIDRQVAVVFDLQGPKVRLASDTPVRQVEPGEEIIVAAGSSTPPGAVAVDWDGFTSAVAVGRSELVVGDGTPRFAITRAHGRGAARTFTGVCTHGGALGPRRGAVVTNGRQGRRAPITAKDRADLRVAAACGADFVALSYVRSAADVEALRALMVRARMRARIIAKIETLEAVDAITAILRVTDAAMVARGDLGVQAGVARVPAIQRSLVRACRASGRLAIMATQMLESMVDGTGPTRAEATDIATAIVQGSSALMLSAETAVGTDPLAAVRAMDEIARAADAVEVPVIPHAEGMDDEESVMRAAALLGLDVGAHAYVVPTSSGGSVRALSRHRPGAPIIALAHHDATARALALEWGVVPSVLPAAGTIDETIEHGIERAARLLNPPPGAPVVITSGTAVDTPGATSVIALRHLPARRRRTA